jgi:hypothetical protein
VRFLLKPTSIPDSLSVDDVLTAVILPFEIALCFLTNWPSFVDAASFVPFPTGVLDLPPSGIDFEVDDLAAELDDDPWCGVGVPGRSEEVRELDEPPNCHPLLPLCPDPDCGDLHRENSPPLEVLVKRLPTLLDRTDFLVAGLTDLFGGSFR